MEISQITTEPSHTTGDSLSTPPSVANEAAGGGGALSPYKVLRMLPSDATPAQQDSAIQSVFQPKEIRYSNRPDTLHLPGQPIGKSIFKVSIPQYYKETYFKTDSMYHPEIGAGRLGIAGDPLPYHSSNDNIITGIILVVMLFVIFVYSRMKHFFLVQIKEFFSPSRREELMQKETTDEVIIQVVLALQTCLVFGLVFFSYTQQFIGHTFIVPSEYMLIGIFTFEALMVKVVQNLCYHAANKTFFPECDLPRFNQSRLMLNAALGIVLMPIMLLDVYFNLMMEITLSYIALALIVYEILMFYKAYGIFFEKNVLKLQIFLYLCTLELAPIALLWGILTQTAYNLTITL